MEEHFRRVRQAQSVRKCWLHVVHGAVLGLESTRSLVATLQSWRLVLSRGQIVERCVGGNANAQTFSEKHVMMPIVKRFSAR